MKRWLTHLFIAGYLGALGIGLFAHALKFHRYSHPVMYFLVWDMYSGWSSYETRYHIIGEGESGDYYQLSYGPWGEATLFGDCGRVHYDFNGLFTDRIANNVLAHSSHEPIHRIFTIEESWPKKYNLPDALWKLRYEMPKEMHTYRHTRAIRDGEGLVLKQNSTWLRHQENLAVLNNPRLYRDVRSGHTYLATHPSDRHRDEIVSPGDVIPVSFEKTED